jgi:DNA replication protein DnaC
VDNHENLLWFGPPGIGNSHLSFALGIKAVETGCTVCFERIVTLIKPIERKEANLFFHLISELYEKSSIILTLSKSFDSWAEMMGDEAMTTTLLDRLLHHARVFTLDGLSYRLQGWGLLGRRTGKFIFPPYAEVTCHSDAKR